MPGREKQSQVEAVVQIVRSECGSAPAGCPWRAPASPLIQDVNEIRARIRADLPVGDVSQRLLDAVAAFNDACESSGAARRKYEEALRKAGHV